jgi:hypothetical protein
MSGPLSTPLGIFFFSTFSARTADERRLGGSWALVLRATVRSDIPSSGPSPRSPSHRSASISGPLSANLQTRNNLSSLSNRRLRLRVANQINGLLRPSIRGRQINVPEHLKMVSLKRSIEAWNRRTHLTGGFLAKAKCNNGRSGPVLDATRIVVSRVLRSRFIFV